jgi:hypothetical protein
VATHMTDLAGKQCWGLRQRTASTGTIPRVAMCCTHGEKAPRLSRLWPELRSDCGPHSELSWHPGSSIESWKSTVRDPAACCRRGPMAVGTRSNGSRLVAKCASHHCIGSRVTDFRTRWPSFGVESRLRKSWIRGDDRKRDHDQVKPLFECGAIGPACSRIVRLKAGWTTEGALGSTASMHLRDRPGKLLEFVEEATAARMNQSRSGSALVGETGGRVDQGMLARSLPACSRPHP